MSLHAPPPLATGLTVYLIAGIDIFFPSFLSIQKNVGRPFPRCFVSKIYRMSLDFLDDGFLGHISIRPDKTGGYANRFSISRRRIRRLLEINRSCHCLGRPTSPQPSGKHYNAPRFAAEKDFVFFRLKLISTQSFHSNDSVKLFPTQTFIHLNCLSR